MSFISDDSASFTASLGTATNAPSEPPAPNESPPSLPKQYNDVGDLGGERTVKALAILDGVEQIPDLVRRERMTIDIQRLPALFGRCHDADSSDPHFYGISKKKVLSRKHFTIYYRDREGGHCEWDDTAGKLVYKDVEEIAKEHDYIEKKKQVRPNHLYQGETSEDGLPPNGFFVIECLGKNRILVDQTYVGRGEAMVLVSGSAIRFNNYFFYFLVPTDAEPRHHEVLVPLTAEEKRAAAKVKALKASKIVKKPTVSKKRPTPTAASTASKKPKKSGNSSAPTASLSQADIEGLPVRNLLERMDDAVSKGLWDRKNQIIGATICLHAVRYAGASAAIQRKVTEDGGVSRSDIMDWISDSKMYGGWVKQMLTNMEPRSYQAAITKALLKSGYERTSGAGRYIKWSLPKDIPIKAKKKTPKSPTKTKATPKPAAKPKPAPKPAQNSELEVTEDKEDVESESNVNDQSNRDDSDDELGKIPMDTKEEEKSDIKEDEDSANDHSRADIGGASDNIGDSKFDDEGADEGNSNANEEEGGFGEDEMVENNHEDVEEDIINKLLNE